MQTLGLNINILDRFSPKVCNDDPYYQIKKLEETDRLFIQNV